MVFATVVQRRGQHMDDNEKKSASRMSIRDYLKMMRAMEDASPFMKILNSPEYQRFRAMADFARKMDPLSDYYDPVPFPSQPSSTAGVAEKLPAPTKDALAQSTQDAGHARHAPGQRWTKEQRRQLLAEIEAHPSFSRYCGKKVAIAEVAERWGCRPSLVRAQLALARAHRKKTGFGG